MIRSLFGLSLLFLLFQITAFSPAQQRNQISIDCAIKNSLFEKNGTCVFPDCSVTAMSRGGVRDSIEFRIREENVTGGVPGQNFIFPAVTQGRNQLIIWDIGFSEELVERNVEFIESVCTDFPDRLFMLGQIRDWERETGLKEDNENKLVFSSVSESKRRLPAEQFDYFSCRFQRKAEKGSWMAIREGIEPNCIGVSALPVGLIVLGMIVLFVFLRIKKKP